MIKFGNGYYKVEEPNDIQDIIVDLDEKESIGTNYYGARIYPFYCLATTEYMGCEQLAIHILPKELVEHLSRA